VVVKIASSLLSFPLNTKAMKRRRFAVRFSDEEFQALEAFANREHVIHSVAVRWLIGMALNDKNPKSGRTYAGSR
jgi:hypothetical protein